MQKKLENMSCRHSDFNHSSNKLLKWSQAFEIWGHKTTFEANYQSLQTCGIFGLICFPSQFLTWFSYLAKHLKLLLHSWQSIGFWWYLAICFSINFRAEKPFSQVGHLWIFFSLCNKVICRLRSICLGNSSLQVSHSKRIFSCTNELCSLKSKITDLFFTSHGPSQY